MSYRLTTTLAPATVDATTTGADGRGRLAGGIDFGNQLPASFGADALRLGREVLSGSSPQFLAEIRQRMGE